MSEKIIYNGKFYTSGKTLFTADNRSFRYGDGLFETIRYNNGKINLEAYHFQRLFSGLEALQFDVPAFYTKEYFSELIHNLCRENDCTQRARVRMTFFRADGGLYRPLNNYPYFIIHAWRLASSMDDFNEEGLVVDIFPGARKSGDMLANIKSNNCLPYIMASIYAKKNQLDDCLLLNTSDQVADATIANVFLVKEDLMITPPLSEGCVSGVMRRNIIDIIKQQQMAIAEKAITRQMLHEADELFFTNTIYGIRWVKSCGLFQYDKNYSARLHERIKTQWQ